jgi:hypothetical protein
MFQPESHGVREREVNVKTATRMHGTPASAEARPTVRTPTVLDDGRMIECQRGVDRATSRRGVALILVLGFTALLLLVAFAFSVRMQTEYRTARLAHSNVRTEPVMVQGLQLAALEAAHYIVETGGNVRSYWFYPRRERISGAEILLGDEPLSAIPNFLGDPFNSYIPEAMRGYAMMYDMTNRWGIIPGGFGASVRDLQPPPILQPESNRVVAWDYEPSGVAYYLVNCSGYLDVHAPYWAASTRPGNGVGTDAGHIALGGVIANPAMLGTGRGQYIRVESMAELRAYGSSFGFVPPNAGDLSAFFTYSRCPLGSYWDTNYNAMVSSFCLTGGIVRVLANLPAVSNAFERSGFDRAVAIGGTTYSAPAIRQWLVANLIDYMDTDFTPQGLMQPSQEPVANINEIAVETDFRCTRTSMDPPEYTYQIGVTVSFEIWNAYLVSPTAPYSIRVFARTITLTPISGPPFVTRANTQPTFGSASIGARSFAVLSPKPVVPMQQVVSPTFTNRVVYSLQFSPPGLVLRRGLGAGVTVDEVEPTGFTLVFTNTLPAEPTTQGQIVSNDDNRHHTVEAVDPRFNWVISNSAFWVVSSLFTNSLGTTNSATLAYLTNTANMTDFEPGDNVAKATYLHSANDDTFETVGELGYLCYAPWRTVRLVRGGTRLVLGMPTEKPLHPVVDTFSLFKSNQVTRGLVNPNTAHIKPLQAVFNAMPVDLYPSSGGSNVSPANASALADAMIRETYRTVPALAPFSPDGLKKGLLNVSQFGSLTNLFPCSTSLSNIGVQCEFERESLVRNCAGLFNTRNIAFTVVLAASDEINGGGGTDFDIRNASRMGSEHKAVAIVWRDPWTKEQFVRFFRYFPNDGALANY